MKEQTSIPTGKVERASKFVSTGIKISGNYIKHYAKKIANPDLDKEQLHQDNAQDIYNSLSQLKGSALKIAQMMSIDRSLLPKAYSERFQMAQYSAPPLSGPLVMRTIEQQLGKPASQAFDSFETSAANAASIGQVHRASKNGQKLAVKIQYPGVADSIRSDLKMVRPMATRLMGLNAADVDRYSEEVEARLLEETNYELELERGNHIGQACAHIKGLRFPIYYPQLSARRILTMQWMEGMHLKEFLATSPSQEIRNQIGQALWDFYDFQIHKLRQVHADPHPGNFLFDDAGTIGIIDFGCIKTITDQFYESYFALLNAQTLADELLRDDIFYKLEFIYQSESPKEQLFFKQTFMQMTSLLARPFYHSQFDFGNDAYFDEIYAFGEYLTTCPQIKESKLARGSKDSLYINRTYFGLYSILNELKAVVNIGVNG